MAEELEESDTDVDMDLRYDRDAFRKVHFDVFKSEFRNTAAKSEEISLQYGYNYGFAAVTTSCRRLGRAEGTIRALIKGDTISSNCESNQLALRAEFERTLTEVLSLLHAYHSVVTEANPEMTETTISEFSADDPKTVPEFDSLEMQLLFDEPISSQATISAAKGLNYEQRTETAIEQLNDRTEKLLVTVCQLLHRIGLCDRFIYQ